MYKLKKPNKLKNLPQKLYKSRSLYNLLIYTRNISVSIYISILLQIIYVKH